MELSTPRLDRVRERFAPGTLARSRWRLAVWTLVVVLAYAVVGVLAGPRWNPEPVSTSVQPETESVSVLGSTPGTVLGRYDTVSRLVDLQLDGATTQVLIVSPLGVPEPLADAGLPAAVFLHGAGTGLAESFAEHAQALASAGVVAVVPSKRLDTYTTTHRDYVAMAADYARSVQLARELPEVDPARVGLYAESEGTWIAPILAVDDPAIAFVALVSAPVVTPREQGAFAVDAYLREVGVPRSFLRAIPRATGAHLPGGILAYADFDVLPYLRELTQPVFMAYGTQDASMPTVQGPQIVAGALPGGVEQLMVRYYADANHGIRIGSSTDPVVPDFLAGLAAWMIDPVAAQAAGPVVAGATPRQVHMASAVPQPRWYADGEMLLRVPGISAAVVIGGFLVVLAGAVIGRAQSSRGLRAFLVPRRRGPLEVPASVRAPVVAAVRFSVVTLVLLVALVAYIVAVAQLALDYSRNGWVVWGGWALVQLLAVACALCAVLTARALVRHARARQEAAEEREAALEAGEVTGPRTGAVARAASGVREAGCWAVLLGAGGLLFVAAYWGAFSPIS
ncbi:alpha/beta hydrolase family protein [Salana multivorans]|uniref:alpha/beta hydrolase family protein n=1 Tax=Salana multivorans TaxID=120377 RepID=UPI000ADF0BBF|nr:alpha/beta hydrolase [Salana multivorans]